MNYQVVIPAAGQGKRMGAGKNKQFITLQSKPIIIHTLNIFELDPFCDGIVLVINKDEQLEIENLLIQFDIKKVRSIIHGGSERQYSVHNGLKSTIKSEVVLIHDGARPFVKHQYIHKLVEVASKNGAATLAVPVKDTIKRVSSDLTVIETVDRSSIWAVHTPQAFQRSLIVQAHQSAEEEQYVGTDDASLVERLGKSVYIVEGDYKNIKLTTPDDLLFAEAILQNWTY